MLTGARASATLAGMTDENKPTWTARGRADADAIHSTYAHGYTIEVWVHDECAWGWELNARSEVEGPGAQVDTASGYMVVDVSPDDWACQGLDEVKARAVAVAAVLSQLKEPQP